MILSNCRLNVGLPRWLSSKESTCQAGDMDSIPGLGRSPGEGKWQPTPVFLPGKSHGQRSLLGYSPWGRKESDTAEHAHTTRLRGRGGSRSVLDVLNLRCPVNRYHEYAVVFSSLEFRGDILAAQAFVHFSIALSTFLLLFVVVICII